MRLVHGVGQEIESGRRERFSQASGGQTRAAQIRESSMIWREMALALGLAVALIALVRWLLALAFRDDEYP